MNIQLSIINQMYGYTVLKKDWVNFNRELSDYIFADVINHTLEQNNKLVVYVNLNTFDIYSYKIITEFKWINRSDIKNSHRLYYQLKSHCLQDFNYSETQSLFDKLCSKDEYYYSDLFMKHWGSQEEIENYDNDEIIKLLLPKIIVNYEHLNNCLKSNHFIFNILIDHIILNNPDKNYELIIEVLKNKRFNLIYEILERCTLINDWDILLIAIQNNIDIITFDLLTKDKRINSKSVFIDAIENNNYNIIEYIIKNNIIDVNEEHVALAKKLKYDKIYYLLCKHV